MRRAPRVISGALLLSLAAGCSASVAGQPPPAASGSATSGVATSESLPSSTESSTAPSAESSPASRPTGSATAPLQVVVVGDSVTEGNSTSVAAGMFGPTSWAYTADRDRVDVVGGWAVKGATTEAMAGGAGPSSGDTLVVMGGTNDVLQGIPWERSAAAITQVVDVVGISDVVLCTIVPSALDPVGAQLFNVRLAELAAEQGWQLVDSAAGVRTTDGQWLAGLSEDGIHPTATAAAVIGTTVHDALVG